MPRRVSRFSLGKKTAEGLRLNDCFTVRNKYPFVVVVVVASLQPTRQTEVSTITATPVQQQAAELQSESNIDVFALKLLFCVFALYRVAYLRPHPHEDVFISKHTTLETLPTPFRFENVQFGREETETSAHTTETLLSATVAVTYWLLEIE